MAEVIIHCPQCQRPLRVTDELRNRLVKCPSCELTFRVPADSDEPQPVTPLRSETALPTGSPPPPSFAPRTSETDFRRGEPEPWDQGPAERERARSAVQLPGIFLLVTGILGLLVNLLSLTQWVTQGEAMLQAVNRFMGPQPDPQSMIGMMIGAHAVL
ncbi:MAG: hypothetical protein L0Z62_44470, partial [Gemmataceae bacterium]|nr:hypothetical protein [Gemmataceae bacterium]